MKKAGLFWITLLLLLWVGCTKNREVEIHPDTWIDPAAEVNHMAKIASSGIIVCRECHGADYRGDKSGVSCYESACHRDGPSGHPGIYTWVYTPQDTTATLEEQLAFHGTAFLLDQRCDSCHDYYHADQTTNPGVNTVGVYCTDCHSRTGETGKITLSCPICHNGVIAPD